MSEITSQTLAAIRNGLSAEERAELRGWVLRHQHGTAAFFENGGTYTGNTNPYSVRVDGGTLLRLLDEADAYRNAETWGVSCAGCAAHLDNSVQDREQTECLRLRVIELETALKLALRGKQPIGETMSVLLEYERDTYRAENETLRARVAEYEAREEALKRFCAGEGGDNGST